jgi:hypothetical protein
MGALRRRWSHWFAVVLAIAPWPVSASQAIDFRFSDRADGISCNFFDSALSLFWPTQRPQWTDRQGTPQGTLAWGGWDIPAATTQRVWRQDVTKLVQAWITGQLPNDGLILRLQGNGVEFHARETPDPTLRPQLMLRFPDGRQRWIEAAADAALDCSTTKGLGGQPLLQLSGRSHGAMRFDLPRLDAGARLDGAELILVRTDRPPLGANRIDIMSLAAPIRGATTKPPPGLAASYTADQGIENHPDVIFSDGYEGGPSRKWKVGMAADARVVDKDDAQLFWPLAGRALRIVIPSGANLGLDHRYRFREHQGTEPEEVFFRYYLRLADSWFKATDGGKLPGMAGTYGVAGWGGRPWDGAKGWSARGSFSPSLPVGHKAQGRLIAGSYVYHAGADRIYGEGLNWPLGPLSGLLRPNVWYCIEQQLRLNSPGRSDGILRAWVDGALAFERIDLRFRDLDSIRIEEVWMNFFHGGTAAAPVDMHAYVDGVVIAKRYIGPMRLP